MGVVSGCASSAQTQHTTSIATKSAPYTRLITTSALALQSQHRNANPAIHDVHPQITCIIQCLEVYPDRHTYAWDLHQSMHHDKEFRLYVLFLPQCFSEIVHILSLFARRR